MTDIFSISLRGVFWACFYSLLNKARCSPSVSSLVSIKRDWYQLSWQKLSLSHKISKYVLRAIKKPVPNNSNLADVITYTCLISVSGFLLFLMFISRRTLHLKLLKLCNQPLLTYHWHKLRFYMSKSTLDFPSCDTNTSCNGASHGLCSELFLMNACLRAQLSN